MSIKIIFSTNDTYSGSTAVAIQSIIEHCNVNKTYDIYVFHSGLSNLAQDKLRALCTVNVHISIVDISDAISVVADLKYGHLTREGSHGI